MIQGDIEHKSWLCLMPQPSLIGQKAKYALPQDQLAGYRGRRQTHDFGLVISFSCLQISDRMIGTAMATRHFMGLCTKRQRHQLMPNANAKNWHIAAINLAISAPA